MQKQLPSEALPGESIVPLSGAGELGRLLALTAASPEAPAWPPNAWTSYLLPTEAPAETRRCLFATEAVDRSLSGIVALTFFEDVSELELLLVHPRHRRQGIGRALSHHWLAMAKRAAARDALLEVRASNLPAQALYEELGFRIEARRPRYYQHPEEDALLMSRRLQHESEPAKAEASPDRKV